ncbi:MAG: hypothetical protein J0M09_10955 [Xanthomonadales bacterium]|nr:hypothetical protein [Xanthomonadales bacterium]
MHRDIRVPAVRDRFVVLHYHIFKNGGSTIDYALRRSFGDAFVDLHGEHDDARLFAQDIVALVGADPSIRAVSSHHTRYPKPHAHGFVFYDICFVRHPLSRIRSLYSYGRTLDPAHWLAQLALAHDEGGFIAHLVQYLPYMLTDVQINHLVNGAAFARAAGPQDLRAALAILEDMSVPGVVELFDESLTAAEFFLGPCFPQIDFAYVAQNVSAPDGHRPSGRDDILDVCRAAWGNDTFDAVLALNVWDLRLYEACREEVLRRLHMLPAHEARLAGFRKRCRALAQV